MVYKRGRKTNYWSLLMHIKAEPQKTILTELLAWHELKSQEIEAIVQGFYIPPTKSTIDRTIDSVLKKYAICFYYLKI